MQAKSNHLRGGRQAGVTPALSGRSGSDVAADTPAYIFGVILSDRPRAKYRPRDFALDPAHGHWVQGSAPAAHRGGDLPLRYSCAIAPAQLEPAPAVHPKQCDAVAIRLPVSSLTSLMFQIVRFVAPIGISSIWLKSQS